MNASNETWQCSVFSCDFDVGLQLLIGRGAGRARAESYRLAGEFQRRRSAEIGAPRRLTQTRIRSAFVQCIYIPV